MMKIIRALGLSVLSTIVLCESLDAQVTSELRIGEGAGGLPVETLAPGDLFGYSIASLGDLDGDGRAEIAVGGQTADDPSSGLLNSGAIWVLTLNPDGSILPNSVRRISRTEILEADSGLTIPPNAHIGTSLAALGDISGDGTFALAVGANNDFGVNTARMGAVYLLFLDSSASIERVRKIGKTDLSCGDLQKYDAFGSSLAKLGENNGNEGAMLAVGATGDGQSGAVWVLELNGSGDVVDCAKISNGVGGISLGAGDNFGVALGSLGSESSGEVERLVVGAFDDDGIEGTNHGAFWVVEFDTAQMSVLGSYRIGDGSGGLLEDTIAPGSRLGASVASIQEFDVPTNNPPLRALMVGAQKDGDHQVSETGALWLFLVDGENIVHAHRKIASQHGGFMSQLAVGDNFGLSTALVDTDLDPTTLPMLAVGAPGTDGQTGTNLGSVWMLSLEFPCASGTVNDIERTRDVLLINGRKGIVEVKEGESVWGTILAPPIGGSGAFAIVAKIQGPNQGGGAIVSDHVGISCFPFHEAEAVWSNLEVANELIGASRYFDGSPIPDPPVAPTVFLQRDEGDLNHLPAGTNVIFQGFVIDDGSSGNLFGIPASVTNAVTLRVTN